MWYIQLILSISSDRIFLFTVNLAELEMLCTGKKKPETLKLSLKTRCECNCLLQFALQHGVCRINWQLIVELAEGWSIWVVCEVWYIGYFACNPHSNPRLFGQYTSLSNQKQVKSTQRICIGLEIPNTDSGNENDDENHKKMPLERNSIEITISQKPNTRCKR